MVQTRANGTKLNQTDPNQTEQKQSKLNWIPYNGNSQLSQKPQGFVVFMKENPYLTFKKPILLHR